MRRILPLLLLTTLAGCVKPDATVVQPAGPPPGIDGRYRGTARLVRGDRFCPRSGPRVYELQGGTVTLAYSAGGRRRVPLSATVQGDGRIQGNDGEGTIDGQVTNGSLDVTIASAQCEHRWTMRLVP